MALRSFQVCVLLGIVFSAVGCQPKDTRPGLWLHGEAGEQQVTDWSFTGDVDEIYVETRTWYGIRHSTTIWCVALDGALYIGSYGYGQSGGQDAGTERKVWEKNVARSPSAQLRISGLLYDVEITPVTGATLVESLDRAYNEKYDMAEVFGEELPDWWYYRVRQPQGEM